MNIDLLKIELQKVLSRKRYGHSIRVVETATELAKIYNADIEKTQIAAILHDYAKEFPREELVNICTTHFEKETKKFLYVGQILHGFASAYIAKEKFNINDSDILNAIIYHTTGRENMSLIEKIVYIADAIEPERNYSYVNEIRDLCLIDLDQAILFETNRKIEYLISVDSIIHLDTLNMRNWLVRKKSN
nr:bis(5'-nucleosyl)-tetraphosphatase (symmetrical) YqeK [uncultured Cetobacterium sp.]